MKDGNSERDSSDQRRIADEIDENFARMICRWPSNAIEAFLSVTSEPQKLGTKGLDRDGINLVCKLWPPVLGQIPTGSCRDDWLYYVVDSSIEMQDRVRRLLKQ